MHIALEGEGIFGSSRGGQAETEQRMGVASNRSERSRPAIIYRILVAVVQGAERWWNWAKQPRAS
ncbi:hypothetical protein BDN71DRAFT_1458043, partial [Pleurotus eryngii]